jgi:hypothetical protein
VHHYTRATPQDPWTEGQIEGLLTFQVGSGISAESASYYMTFADKTAYLSVFQGENNRWELQKTTRGAAMQPWGAPVSLDVSTLGTSDEFPFINFANDKLYFMNSKAVGGYRLFMSAAVGTSFKTPTQVSVDAPVAVVNHYAPVLSKDGTTLYFSGSIQGSGRRIFRAKGGLSTFTGTIGDPTLNIGTTNQLTWLSPDTCEAYMTIDGRIYKARKPN